VHTAINNHSTFYEITWQIVILWYVVVHYFTRKRYYLLNFVQRKAGAAALITLLGACYSYGVAQNINFEMESIIL
jgi:hypothetical protein